MKMYEFLVTDTPKGAFYFINGKRVKKSQYEWIEKICLYRFSNFSSTINGEVVRHRKTGAYKP